MEDVRLQKLKGELTQWERDFKAIHGRQPNSQDAPPIILAKYKELATLRKNAIEARARQRGDTEDIVLPRAVGTNGIGMSASSPLNSLSASFATGEFTLASTARSISANGSKNGLSISSLRPLKKEGATDVSGRPIPQQIVESTEDHVVEGPVNSMLIPKPLTLHNQTYSQTVAARSSHVVSEYDLLESDDDDEGTSSSDDSIDSSLANPSQLRDGDDFRRNVPKGMSASSPKGMSASSPKAMAISNKPSVPATNTSFFGAFPKSEPNYVRLNMKRDWRAKKHSLIPANRDSRAKEKSRAFFSNQEQETRHENPDDVITIVTEMLDSKPQKLGYDGPVRVPRCGHDIPCVELVVKKASTGNKGRVFYGCSLGREGSCGFFLWKDDTASAARAAFAKRVKPSVVGAAAAGPPGPSSTEMEVPKWILLCSISELKMHIHRFGGSCSGKKKLDLITELQDMWRMKVEEARELSMTASRTVQDVLETVFFHDDFLPGQKEAIERILAGRHTLVVRATGSGKSLIYQLPAFMLPGITIVVSPLISLMQDQISQLPPGLGGCSLSGTQKEQAESLADLVNGRAKILFLSPERIFTSSFLTLLKKLPAVSLVCIDEAHCMSSWSHNFRPAYLRLGEAIKRLFPGAIVLALTATATCAVQEEICRYLDIEQETGVKLEGTWQRANLQLKVEAAPLSEDKRVVRLVELLKKPTKEARAPKQQKLDGTIIESAIVYATTKSDTRVLAERLENYGVNASPYHSGMEAANRKKVQADFLRSKLPVVVATVAFGMGLNKLNVRRVVHYRAPRSIEEYVQEIGRAGRDGERSSCVCLFDADGEESRRLLSLARSDGVEHEQLKMLLSILSRSLRVDIFSPIYPSQLVTALDCKEGVLETILVFLASEHVVELGPSGYGRAEISFGPEKVNSPQVVQLARRLSVVEDGKRRVDLTRLAEAISTKENRCTVSFVIRALCEAREKEFLVNFSLIDRCWFVRRSERWLGEEKCGEKTLLRMQQYCENLEERGCGKIKALFSVMSLGMTDCEAMTRRISEYLEGKDFALDMEVPFDTLDEIARRALIGDINSLLKDSRFLVVIKELRTARAVTRILHAVASPAYPHEAWSSHRLWGRYKRYRFEEIRECALSVLRAAQ